MASARTSSVLIVILLAASCGNGSGLSTPAVTTRPQQADFPMPSRENARALADDPCGLGACKNGGTCVKSKLANGDDIAPRCVCQDAFRGEECQFETKSCYTAKDGTEVYCKNEAQCVTYTDDGDGQDKRACDCNQAHIFAGFAGRACEYVATEYCTPDGSLDRKAFCTNGGRCKGTVEDSGSEGHPGCDCVDDFEGARCGYPEGMLGSNGDDSSDFSETAKQIMYGILIAAMVGTLICVCIIIRRYMLDRHMERLMLAEAVSATADLALDSDGESSLHPISAEDEGLEVTKRKKKGGSYAVVDHDLDENEII